MEPSRHRDLLTFVFEIAEMVLHLLGLGVIIVCDLLLESLVCICSVGKQQARSFISDFAKKAILDFLKGSLRWLNSSACVSSQGQQRLPTRVAHAAHAPSTGLMVSAS